MPSPIKRLSDEDREALNHMIRRDAASDDEIAAWVESRLGEPLSGTDAGRRAVVDRWRTGKPYSAWLKRWNEQTLELETRVRLQRERYEFLSELMKDSATGAGAVAKGLQARLLTVAAEMSDEDLVDALKGRNWLKNLLGLV